MTMTDTGRSPSAPPRSEEASSTSIDRSGDTEPQHAAPKPQQRPSDRERTHSAALLAEPHPVDVSVLQIAGRTVGSLAQTLAAQLDAIRGDEEAVDAYRRQLDTITATLCDAAPGMVPGLMLARGLETDEHVSAPASFGPTPDTAAGLLVAYVATAEWAGWAVGVAAQATRKPTVTPAGAGAMPQEEPAARQTVVAGSGYL